MPAGGNRCRLSGLASHRPFQHEFLDVADGARGIQSLGADFHAVHDGMAAEQLERSVQAGQSLIRCVVAAVGP